MIHLNLICGHIVAYKRVQGCPNRLSHLREDNVSFVEMGLQTTFSTISPEPEVAAMILLYLICGHIMAFKRAQGCSNWLSCLQETVVSS